jgi:hypothetical protein
MKCTFPGHSATNSLGPTSDSHKDKHFFNEVIVNITRDRQTRTLATNIKLTMRLCMQVSINLIISSACTFLVRAFHIFPRPVNLNT